MIDSFAFVSPYEAEELLLRFYEMGEEVSEFHIVEGDRDFVGAMKPYCFDAILNSGQMDRWKNKIAYHQVKIPEGVRGYALQDHFWVLFYVLGWLGPGFFIEQMDPRPQRSSCAMS